ncbi:MAG TPA: His/Gly/Thr/Pro-type tRNA ligase C-terminal domain-containing protein, partial [Bdellovibrionota bacterium]|nr:His/Gly/Thr/Pro-type tRNA ligase C-terminal domain-containing protein [Bdellovibrionota bacterium]
AKAAFDIQYRFPFGWQELEGIHNRTDYDLSRHQEYSGKNLQYFDEERKEKYLPYIIETSAGCDRTVLCVLCDAFAEEAERTVMRFAPFLAPVQVAILPLVKKDGLPEIAQRILGDLRPHFAVFYDDSGSVGRRYRRQDEIGTPYAVTVDSQTKEDETVTVRERDRMTQERIKIAGLRDHFSGLLAPPL